MVKVIKLNLDQIPSNIGKGIVEWDLGDYGCNLAMKNKKATGWTLSGEWVDWVEEKQEWVGRPMTEAEAKEIMVKVDLVMPDGTKAIDWLGKGAKINA